MFFLNTMSSCNFKMAECVIREWSENRERRNLHRNGGALPEERFLLGLAPSFTRILVALSLANSAQISRNFWFSHRAPRHLCTEKSRVNTGAHNWLTPATFSLRLTLTKAVWIAYCQFSVEKLETRPIRGISRKHTLLRLSDGSHFIFEIVSNAVFLSPVKLSWRLTARKFQRIWATT